MDPRSARARFTRISSAAIAVVGVAVLVTAPARGAGPVVYAIGALLVAAGLGRLFLARRGHL